MFIPDPNFYPFRIPDPKTATNEKREKICCPTCFVATNITKLKPILLLNWRRKKIWANLQRITEILTQKTVIKLSKIWFQIQDPRSGIRKNLFQIPDSRVKKAPDPGSGSATMLWASVVCGCQPLPTQTRLPLTMLFCPEYLVNTYSTK
jgi:hypothetical protein